MIENIFNWIFSMHGILTLGALIIIAVIMLGILAVI